MTGFVVLSLFACQDQSDIYQDFVTASKNKVYPGKVINAVAYSGKNRIKISFANPIDPSVKEVRIFWNFYADSIVAPINNLNRVQEFIIPDLSENSYSLILKSYDAKNNVSVPVEVFGNSYGSFYQSRIFNRELINIVNNTTTKTLTLTFGPADISNGAFQTTVNYINTSDTMATAILDKQESVLTITNYKSGATYSTQYKPEPTSIDVFTSTSKSVF